MGRNGMSDVKVDEAKPHTIQKFHLIEEYVAAWAQKLLHYEGCDGLVFIDCMCNSGIYKDIDGNPVYGTPIRIARLLADTIKGYPGKKVELYFNDLSEKKIELLIKHLPPNTSNFIIHTSAMDGNDLLRKFLINPKHPYLLIYDPYQATIDWDALEPFLNEWGEVIINHMVSDIIRGLPKAKKQIVKDKYEATYQSDINELIEIGCDREAYEKKIREILARKLITSRKHYFASFPFFNRSNGQVYSLIHCTGHIKGFKLFKTTAWKTFGGKSSAKNMHGMEKQLMFNLDGSNEATTATDETCYNISDISKYLCVVFKGRKDILFEDVFSVLDEHPIFPSEGFRDDIKKDLKAYYGVVSSRSTLSFP